jgi:hypothetical protein
MLYAQYTPVEIGNAIAKYRAIQTIKATDPTWGVESEPPPPEPVLEPEPKPKTPRLRRKSLTEKNDIPDFLG